MKNADMPAMPLPLGTETEKWCQGLTKREMMAMHIMQGMISCENLNPPREEAAQLAVGMADALLAELERTK